MAHDTFLAGECPEELSVLLHDLVAHDHTHSVVDLSEIINVYEQDADNALLLLRLPQELTQKLHEIVAVVEPRQLVVVRHVLQFIVLLLEFCNIPDTDDLVRGRALLVVGNPCLQLQPPSAVL